MVFKIIAIALYVLAFAFELMLKISNYRSRKNQLPENVNDIYDAEAYEKFKNYTADHTKVSIIFSIVSFVVTGCLLFTPVMPWVSSLSANYYNQAMLVMAVYLVVDFVISLISSYVFTMKVEEKYGFNKATVKVWISDNIKSFIIESATMIGIANLVVLLHQAMHDWIIILLAGIVFVFILLIAFLFPFLSRIFNKFEPLEEGELKTKLTGLLESHGFHVREIKVMKASLKTTKANAYFSGFGKTKTIVLFDTLIQVMTEDEIVAVFAHELGHGLHKDTLKNNILSFANISIMSVLLWLLLKLTSIYESFGFGDINYGFAILLLMSVVLPFISPIINIISSFSSRKAEYRADAQAVKEGYGQELISALKVLSRSNMSNLAPNKLNVVLEYSHPTTSQRISAIEALLKEN